MRGIRFFDPKRYFFLLLLFLFIFPKGGFKIGGLPITWGYLLLGLITLFSLFSRKFQIQKGRLGAFFCLIPFQIVSASTMCLLGVTNAGMAISFWISFLILPFALLLVFSQEIEEIDAEWFFQIFKRGMLFLSLYGIAIFIYRALTGEFLEIPLLTTNISDYGLLNEKCNTRGLFAKLISTYNNGNLYGICLIMALPLYCYLEKKTARQWVVKLSFLLTLSRTIWAGLFLHELVYRLLFSKNKASAIGGIVGVFFLFTLFLYLIALMVGFPMSFFFDGNLGGRDVQLMSFADIGLFPSKPFHEIFEVVYVGVAHSFGWIGFLTFLAAMILPPFFRIASTPKLSGAHLAIGSGLINYFFISFSDGGILFLPTMAFFWFFVSLLFRKSFFNPKIETI